MKKLINYFKLIKLLNKSIIHLQWYKILQQIIDFVIETHKYQGPMLTKIAIIDMSKDKIMGDHDIVSLWAGVGDTNPIERNKQLKAQNLALKDLLKKTIPYIGANNDLILNVNITLETFE